MRVKVTGVLAGGVSTFNEAMHYTYLMRVNLGAPTLAFCE